VHYPLTRDALLSGRHVFCEKCLVFKPDEVHELRALAESRPKQVLQTGLQRRYSQFYQMVKDMVDKGVLGNVHHIHAQWHRNMINKPSRLWTMKPGGPSNLDNWRLYRQFSGGLTAELTSHQVDIADWMFGSSPEFVMGLGSLDLLKDGRDVYDNIQLIYRYPNGQKLTYSAISTNQFLPYFNGTRPEMGEIIMGTDGTIEITVGDDVHMPVAWWYREPPKTATVEKANDKKQPFVAGATMIAAGGANGPIPLMTGDLAFDGKESFLDREVKYARRWLYSKGVFVQEEQRNPVDVELESFFQNCRDGGRPKADLEIGMADAVAVILSNQAMDEGRKVYFSEIEKMGTWEAGGAAGQPEIFDGSETTVNPNGLLTKESTAPSNSRTVPAAASFGNSVVSLSTISAWAGSMTPIVSSFGLPGGSALISAPFNLGSGLLCRVSAKYLSPSGASSFCRMRTHAANCGLVRLSSSSCLRRAAAATDSMSNPAGGNGAAAAAVRS
jgi:predicted dehydrogenase